MKILLTGNTFHGYDSDLLNALKESGHEAKMIFNNIHGPFNTLRTFPSKLKYGILPSKFKYDGFQNRSIKQYNQAVLKELQRTSYDLVIFIGAKTILEESLQKIRIPKALWFMDGVKYYPQLIEKFKYFDSVFLFEPTDVPIIQEQLKNPVQLLHLGFNPKRFFPTHTAKQYDFSFVGSCYPNRDTLLQGVIREPYSGLIIGDFKKSNSPEIRKANKKAQIPIQETNLLFNQSEININIHHQQSIEGLNVRTFEIMGSGNVQLLDYKKMAALLFKDEQDLILYHNEAEFKDKLNFYLKNKDLLPKIRSNAYETAIQRHTWQARMDELIRSLNEHRILS